MQHFIAHYGILAVFLLMLAESACIPVPSEVIMLFGGALAAGTAGATGSSHPSLIGIIAAGAIGNVVGSYIAWAAGRYWGQAAVLRFGRRLHIKEHDIDRATGWFDRYGPVAVLVGRVVPVVRTFISLPAGFANMPAVRFGIYTTLGCIPWTAGLGYAGYQLGSHWDNLAKVISKASYVVIALIVIAAAIAFFVHRRRRGRAAADEEYYPPYDEYPPQQQYYDHPVQHQYPSHHEAGYSPDEPSPAERFWGQAWDSPQQRRPIQPPPPPDRHPQQRPYDPRHR